MKLEEGTIAICKDAKPEQKVGKGQRVIYETVFCWVVAVRER